MSRKVVCPYCKRNFVFDAEKAPAQRWRPKGRRETERVVAYYPTCPRCRGRVEVSAATELVPTPDRPKE